MKTMQQEPVPVFSLVELPRILNRHKLPMVVFFVFFMTTLLLSVYLSAELYESTSTMLIKVGRENITLPVLLPAFQQQVVASLGVRREDINSEIEILKNNFIIEQIVKEIGTAFLFPQEGAPTTPLKKIRYEIKQLYKGIKDQLDEFLYLIDLKKRLTLFEKGVLMVGKNLSAKQVSNSDVIDVRFRWYSPDIATTVLKRFVEHYLENHITAHKTSEATELLQKQVDILAKELKESENKLQKLKENQSITSYEEQLVALQRQLTTFTAAQKDTQTELAESSKVIEELTEKKNAILRSIPPGFNAIYSEIEKDLVLQGAKQKGTTAKLEMLNHHIDSYQQDSARLNHYDTELKRLSRQIQFYTDTEYLYRKKLEEARIADVLDKDRIVNVRVLAPAVASPIPVKPAKMMIIGIGAFLGLVLSMIVAFVAEYLSCHAPRVAAEPAQGPAPDGAALGDVGPTV